VAGEVVDLFLSVNVDAAFGGNVADMGCGDGHLLSW
jgi:16S rRNA G1207 methylase RsmC